MSKSKEGSKKKPLDKIESTARDAIEQGEKVWLAGLGALVRAHEEGRELIDRDKAELFDELAGAGREFADRAAETGQTQFEKTRDAVRDSFAKAREQVMGTYDRAIGQTESGVDKIAEHLGIEQIFDRRVEKALERLGYPTKKQFDSLKRKVNAPQRKTGSAKAASPKKKSA